MTNIISIMRILLIIVGLTIVSYSGSLECDCLIHGRVTDLFGSPISKASVILEFAKGQKDATLVTDENGKFCFSETVEGRFIVTVRSPGFVSETFESSIFEGNSNPINFGLRVGIVDLRPVVTIRGTVKKNRQSVIGADVIAFSAFNPRLRHITTSDANGKFALNISEPGIYILVALSSSFGETTQVIKILGSVEHKILATDLFL